MKIRFFISLCFLLWTGCSSLYAATCKDALRYSSLSIAGFCETAQPDTPANLQTLQSTSSEARHGKANLEATELKEEKEDEKGPLSPQQLDVDRAFITIAYLPLFHWLVHFQPLQHPQGQQVSYGSQDRYLFLRVLRL
ncbi:hypothetical protein BWI93_02010 [Siphonobacter sp. BAB-5385]|uniref:hypothetical protein n=1 Tax=unclassified Siphonobacter TaxID=2635712 RepID=UPI000B9DD837|nr:MULTISPECIES: hypothetical protein [unclassified Siphonobacter]OZI09666.1 hypothetical protein BWI93_02010 [Siphonobacter sp. BAB-5385]PMD92460.1 hypothetical protein BWI97_20445 [Siphonobacter sp. BAB-5405]